MYPDKFDLEKCFGKMLVPPQAFFFTKEKLQIITLERKTPFSPFLFSLKQNSGAEKYHHQKAQVHDMKL